MSIRARKLVQRILLAGPLFVWLGELAALYRILESGSALLHVSSFVSAGNLLFTGLVWWLVQDESGYGEEQAEQPASGRAMRPAAGFGFGLLCGANLVLGLVMGGLFFALKTPWLAVVSALRLPLLVIAGLALWNNGRVSGGERSRAAGSSPSE